MDTRLAALILALLGLFGPSECKYRQKRIVGGVTVPTPPVDDPLVFVRKGDLEARVFGTRDPKTGYYLFRGIRYAEPPVGNRRFQRSVPLYLENEVNATEWGPPCPQPGANGGVIGSEDCLFLNVFTPALPDATDGYPVLVWIHGGNFRRGAATQYEMRNLVEKKTIVVSIQYRLGSLGFLSTGTKDLSGNNGLFDQILAVEWVRDYIEFFGGNPKRITAMGQGSGASSAFMLGLSKFGNTYFSGIVAMSGSLLSHFAIDREPRKSADAMATEHKCPVNDTVRMVRCLRALPFEKLVDQDTKQEGFLKKAKNFITDLSSLLNPGPVVEGKNDFRYLPNFVTDEPENSLSLDDLPEVPLLTGVMKDETGGAVYGPFRDVISRTLEALPDFITKELVPSLQKIVPTIGGVTRQFVPEAFGKYLDPFVGGPERGNGVTDGILKVTEALNDAIFNVPAFLTVKNWSKKTKAFLYSFDHHSTKGFGNDFLQGLPIVADSSQTGMTGHGDDLGYVFEPNGIDGKAMPGKKFDEEDERVMDVYTDMIVNFARSGDVKVSGKNRDGGSQLFSLPALTGSDDDGFLSISSQPKVENKFRFCEMGLWTGLEERFKSAACSLFFVDIPNPLQTFQKSVSAVSNGIPSFPKVGSVADFFNPNSSLASAPPFQVPLEIPKLPTVIPQSNTAGLPQIPFFNRPSSARPTRRPTSPRRPLFSTRSPSLLRNPLSIG
ncbi:liver carboxylesterase 1-like [Copidosoma floridanum]|uniref:liver carboxylesterase 1-like n=1 Tax=Copidosoma floridanum TaxID=29053 RepID=UPI0006C95F9E|nr:liver carboxylesterase 1-like [Copidosoma floridanum]